MKRIHQRSAGVKETPLMRRTKSSYEEKVKIVNDLLKEKPHLNTRLKITKWTGYRNDILNKMAENGDVPNMPPKVENSKRHRWTNSLGLLSIQKWQTK